MKLHVVQKSITDKNLDPWIERAIGASTDMVVFGELATSGCLYESRPVPTLEEVSARLDSFPITVMTGLPLQCGDALRNTYMYTREGRRQFYYKINLFPPMNETKVYQPGYKPGIIETESGKLGVAICYDLRFPVLFDELKEQGADMIFVPAAFPRIRIADWRELLVERAVATSLPVVGINAVGDDGVNEFGGCSMVVNGDGEILHQADETSETVIEAVL